MFQCGDGLCVNASLICDGRYDCIDAADERDCSEYRMKFKYVTSSYYFNMWETKTKDLCRAGQWRCEGGQCLDPGLRCDGRRDCQDGTDELDCQQGSYFDPMSPPKSHLPFVCTSTKTTPQLRGLTARAA